jgi:hypothetical protein
MVLFLPGRENTLKDIPHLSGYLKLDQLLKKATQTGLIERAKPTIDKTIRIFRMLMIWAKDKDYIEKPPFTKELCNFVRLKPEIV